MQKPSKIDKRSTTIELNQQTSSKTNITDEFSIKCIRFIRNITFKLLPDFRIQNLSRVSAPAKCKINQNLVYYAQDSYIPQKQKLFWDYTPSFYSSK